MSKDPLNLRNERVREAFDTRRVSDFSEDELHEFTDTLCDDGLRSAEGQSRAMLRILAINHVQMQRHITALNTTNGATQRWVIALAVAALVAAVVQIICAVRSELRYAREHLVLPNVPANSQPSLPNNAQKQTAPGNVQSGGTVTQPPPKH